MRPHPPDDVEALLTRYLPALRAFVRMRMGPELRAREESCDIMQSVAREILQQRQRFQHGGEAGFREWLYTTAHRKVVKRLSRWRSQKRSNARETIMPSELAGLDATPSVHASAKEQLGLVERAFDSLSSEQRDVVTWSRLLGLSHAEIAVRLGKTETAVRKMLSRAIAQVVALLDEPPAAAGSPEGSGSADPGGA